MVSVKGHSLSQECISNCGSTCLIKGLGRLAFDLCSHARDIHLDASVDFQLDDIDTAWGGGQRIAAFYRRRS
jgi:hypothetical protein